MTFSIIALCPRSRRFGVASATFSIACGRRNESVRANVGVSKSQAFYLRQVDVVALNMLSQGHTPGHIMQALESTDPDFAYRQFGIIDREGHVAMHTGEKTNPWCGHIVGPNFAAYGNTLQGPATVEGIVAGFNAAPDAPLEERLLQAIEGGRDAGGQASQGEHLPERSAWLRVVGQLDWPEIDLRVDLHTDAVGQLRSVYTEFKRYAGYYATRDRAPRGAMSEADFAASL
jgi:uncharacterized Ntn-hydrolase superfamily protein